MTILPRMSDASAPTYPGGFDAILTQMEGRRDPFTYEGDEALPPLDVDFTPLKSARVDGRALTVAGSRSSYARKLRDLSEEFDGLPELMLLHGLLIAHLRRRSAPDHTAALFLRLWAEEADWLLARLDVPDLVEINFNRAGTFFRGPVDDVGFVDLTPYLSRTDSTGVSYKDRILPSRLAVYTNRGRVFGLPHDFHPHAIAYRRDIFEAHGIDAGSLKTWDDFIAAGHKVTVPDRRYMIQFDDTTVYSYEALLLQRGVGFFDADGGLTIDSEEAVRTMLWLVPLVAGRDRIADNPAIEGQAFYKAIADGYISITPLHLDLTHYDSMEGLKKLYS